MNKIVLKWVAWVGLLGSISEASAVFLNLNITYSGEEACVQSEETYKTHKLQQPIYSKGYTRRVSIDLVQDTCYQGEIQKICFTWEKNNQVMEIDITKIFQDRQLEKRSVVFSKKHNGNELDRFVYTYLPDATTDYSNTVIGNIHINLTDQDLTFKEGPLKFLS